MLNCTRPFKFHKWNSWEVTHDGKFGKTKINPVTGAPYKVAQGYVLIQMRTCADCGLQQVKTVKIKAKG